MIPYKARYLSAGKRFVLEPLLGDDIDMHHRSHLASLISLVLWQSGG